VPLLCFDGDAAGQRASARAALRALPLLKPGKSLAFITLPPGQDPDDLIRAGGAAAIEALLVRPQSLDARIWAEEFAARPLDTPEARAGLRQRLRAHLGEIADRDVRQGYADAFDDRFREAFQRPARTERPAPRRDGGWRGAPVRDATLDALKARGGRSPSDAAFGALIAGGLERPGLFVRHAEALAALPLASDALSRLRSALFEAVATLPHLDKASLQHTLDAAGVGALAKEVRRDNRLAFSFTRSGGDDARAEDDFVHVLDALVARRALDLALAEATARFRASLGDADYAEQQRVLGEREAVDARLKALARRDDG
jgi:DNA primase